MHSIGLLFKIGYGAAIDQNAHVLSHVALVIQDIGAEARVLGECLIQDLANGCARRFHRGTIHVAAQVGREVDLGHATRLSRGMFLAIRYEAVMKRRSLILLFAGWPFPVAAHSFKAGDIAIGHAWALPTTQQDAQVFTPLLNSGKTRDSLLAARTGIASLVELRPNNKYDEKPMQEFVLDPGKPFPMRPTSRHMRLVGLSMPLAKGDTFNLVLDFLNAGEVEIEVHVQETPSD